MAASAIAIIKETAAKAAAGAAPPASLGEVLGVDQAAFKVRVRLQPSGIETDWLRVVAPLFRWADVALPEVGDEVLVVTAAAEQIVVGQLFNGLDRAPTSAKEVARKGDQVKVTVSGVAGGQATITAYGTIEEGSSRVKLDD